MEHVPPLSTPVRPDRAESMPAARSARDPRRAQFEANTPMRRAGQPEDIAWLALYLASDESSWVTAADFAIDGKEDSAKAGFLRCADKASQAIVMAEDVPQVLRSTVLKARCLAVLPDRAAAAAVL